MWAGAIIYPPPAPRMRAFSATSWLGFHPGLAFGKRFFCWSIAPQNANRPPNWSLRFCGSCPGTFGCTGLITSIPISIKSFRIGATAPSLVVHHQHTRVRWPSAPGRSLLSLGFEQPPPEPGRDQHPVLRSYVVARPGPHRIPAPPASCPPRSPSFTPSPGRKAPPHILRRRPGPP